MQIEKTSYGARIWIFNETILKENYWHCVFQQQLTKGLQLQNDSNPKWTESQDLGNTTLQVLWIYANENIMMLIFSLMLCSLLYINIKIYLYTVISSHIIYQCSFWISIHHHVDMIRVPSIRLNSIQTHI